MSINEPSIMTYQTCRAALHPAQQATLCRGGSIHLNPDQILPMGVDAGHTLHLHSETWQRLLAALKERKGDVVIDMPEKVLHHNEGTRGSFAFVDPTHWHKHFLKFRRGAGVRLVAGKAVQLHAVDGVCHSPREGYSKTWLSHAQHEKLMRAAEKGQKFTWHPSAADLHHNAIHGSGLFDSVGEFFGGVYNGLKVVGSFLLENAPAILDTIADILPPSSPQLLAAKAALKVASDVTRKVDGIRKSYTAAEDAKEAARAKIEAAKQAALDKELALREAGAKKEAIAKAQADTKIRIAKLREEAKRAGAKAVKEKRALTVGEAKAKAAAAKVESRIQAAQQAADKVQGKK